MYKNNNKAFTLIELLVVISIIGLLSTVVLASLNTARGKARDARRLSDMKQVQLALELYRDKNGAYPSADFAYPRENSCGSSASGALSVMATKWGSSLTALVTAGFLPSLPNDPKPSTWVGDAISENPDYCYGYSSTNSASTYHNCINIQTSSIADIRDYEYILYTSLETRPTNGYRPYWGADGSPATYDSSFAVMNKCILGPKK